MKTVFKLFATAVCVLAVASCATQEEAPAETMEVTEAAPETTEQTDQAAGESSVLDDPEIAYFETAAGTAFATNTVVTLPTGGSSQGQLLPMSSSGDVTLFVTRDGSVPSAENNWGGGIDPQSPPPISRPLEGVATYRVVAELEGEYSEPVTLTVIWEHEESPELAVPTFLVDGREVSGSIRVPVSDGNDPAAQLQISCAYASADLYISRDGSEPTPDEHWRTQTCQGTYIWSPEPTAAQYRVIAVWQGSQSPVASLDVEWVEEE